MTTERIVDRLGSVFDMKIHQALNLPESVSARVMLTYCKMDNTAQFKVLGKKTPEELKRRITSWLGTHISMDDLVIHLGSEEIDMDTLPRVPNS